jgi:hypothetical protein
LSTFRLRCKSEVLLGQNYQITSGTFFAGYVSMPAALMLESNPALTPQELRRIADEDCA